MVALIRRPEEQAQRFWKQVDKSAGPDGCWPFFGSIRPNGYGSVYVLGSGRAHPNMMGAHCMAFALANRITDLAKTVVCHSCDNSRCCNPKHLWAGTQKLNMQDCISKGRFVAPPPTDWPERMKLQPHHWQRLSREQVILIKDRLAAGEKQQTIADDFGVNSRTISKINVGQRWAHL